MTDTGTAIATLLASNGYGTLATNIFVSLMPATPDAVVVVSEYGSGAPPELVMGAGVPIHHPGLQVRIRGSLTEDYDVVHARATSIWKFIAALGDGTLSSDRYLTFTPNGSPELESRDDLERVIFVCNFSVTKVVT
jgi:hypothetical protein